MGRRLKKWGMVLFVVGVLFFALAGQISEAQSQFDSIRVDDIKAARLSSARIPGNSLTPNTIIIFSTNEGRFGKLLIKSCDYNLNLAWVTFNADGTVYSRGDNLVVRGTFTCDLDAGREARDSADFWWQMVSQAERYLTPQNGAAFAIFTQAAGTAGQTISGQRVDTERIDTSTTKTETAKQADQTKEIKIASKLTELLKKSGQSKTGTIDIATSSSGSSVSSKDQPQPEPILLPGQVLGLRHNMNNDLTPEGKYIVLFSAPLDAPVTRLHGGDLGGPLHRGYEWWMVKDNPSGNPGAYVLPPGIVFALKHNKNQGNQKNITLFGRDPISGPNEFSGFKKFEGGDLGEGSRAGDGYRWYESTGEGFTDWSIVDRLPKYTVIGLKHSQNQKNKVLYWKGKTYDPADPNQDPPEGFIKVHGGDRGASAGVGYYWYEKIDGPEIISIPNLEVTLKRSLIVNNNDPNTIDMDKDALVDSLENELADIFRPYLIFDSAEVARKSYKDKGVEEPIVLFQVHPIFLKGYYDMIGIRWVFLFRDDGGYGPDSLCPGWRTDHDGDNDAAYWELVSKDNGVSWKVESVIVSDKDHAWPYKTRLEIYDMTHPVIYFSAHKHHMYFTRDYDHRNSLYSDWSTGDLNCNDDVNGNGVRFISDIKSFGRVVNSRIPYNNVGEMDPDCHPSPPFVNDLSAFYSGHSAWSRKDFYSSDCGPMIKKWLPKWMPFRLWTLKD